MASRRAAEALLREGRVRVNGAVARLGDSADPARDRIELDGRVLALETRAYWMLHKPRGVVTTRSDPEGRPTVLDLLPDEARALRLYPVGRLDLDSEGLVLLTNDGALAQRLLHPSFGSEKEYVVSARGAPSEETLQRLREGLALEPGGRPTAPARVELVARDAAKGSVRLRITLREGRKRQIRRMLSELGHPVRRLVRVRIGPLRLGRLPLRAARPLSPDERRALERHAARAGSSTQLPPQDAVPAAESRTAKRPRKPRSKRTKSH